MSSTFFDARARESFVATYVYKQVVPVTEGYSNDKRDSFLINRCKFLIIFSSLEKYNSFKQ